MVPFDEDAEDKPWWKESSNGTFSLKCAWNALRVVGVRLPTLTDLWHPTITPSLSVFMWRLIHEFIPMDDRLREKGLTRVSKCLCCNDYESLSHLFLNSLPVREVWSFFGTLFGPSPPKTEHISTILQFWKYSSPFSSRGHIRLLIPMLIMWNTWKARNNAKFNAVRFSPQGIIKSVLSYLWRLYRSCALSFQHWKGDVEVGRKLSFRLYVTKPPALKLATTETFMQNFVLWSELELAKEFGYLQESRVFVRAQGQLATLLRLNNLMPSFRF
ncbi:UNVERIFIED_CONTAM: hypothetical protein Sradi_3002100 [Sesamum radiatum]|uniref:Reverse transcriptase zinc-binding domain-containing protein n=1 Tax=Sesamum radiatum TaxID=300843 RepID=A0AAW2S147_SESRA